MNSKISQIKITSKLPGYLFVLANITNIDEKIFLSCPKEDYLFTNSMLKEIGIHAQHFSGTNIALLILDNLQILNTITYTKNKQICYIVYIENETISAYYKKEMEIFLIQHPQCIIIINTKLTVTNKSFDIYLNKSNRYFDKIQNIY